MKKPQKKKGFDFSIFLKDERMLKRVEEIKPNSHNRIQLSYFI
jgi:hypothetical protein